jgi:hypothetical protein
LTGRSLLRAFLLLWWTVGLLLLVGSVQTLHGALAPKHQHSPLALLAALEALAAVLFLIPKTLLWGAIGLLLSLGVAFVAHLFLHQLRWDLLVDSVVVFFVAVHGTLSPSQWREATRRA